MFSHSFLPLISQPTRITSHTATLIDNIFTNHLPHAVINGIFFTDISDHLPIFTLLSQAKSVSPRTRAIRRVINTQNVNKFQDELENFNWDNLYQYHDPNEAYNYFISKYNEIYNVCFPFSLMSKRKSKLLTKPLITQGLLKSIKTKSKLYKAFLHNPSSLNHVQYKQYRNKLNHLLKISKRNYYDCKIESAKNNLKAVWKLLNTIINGRKIKSPNPSTF